MRRPASSAVRLAVLPLAALVVHWLRYQLAFGEGPSHELTLNGHAYLGDVVPWAMGAAVFSLVAITHDLVRRRPPDVRSPWRLWLGLSATLVAMFAGQELLEGLLSSGHLSGPSEVFGHGGLWAIPAAIAVAGALTLAHRGEHRLAQLLQPAAHVPGRRSSASVARTDRPDVRTADPLAGAGAGRAPPGSLAPA